MFGAIKATSSTDSKGIGDHFVISCHFIWCQRCGSLSKVNFFSKMFCSVRTNECAYIFYKNQNKVCEELNVFLQVYENTQKMPIFQMALVNFCTLTEISLNRN